jgi:hypothetical protein
VFYVSTIGNPPAESRATSKLHLGTLDLFAPQRVKTSKTFNSLTFSGSSKYSMFKVDDDRNDPIPEDTEIIVLSDVHLEKAKV